MHTSTIFSYNTYASDASVFSVGSKAMTFHHATDRCCPTECSCALHDDASNSKAFLCSPLDYASDYGNPICLL
jgi:hypothetical protein